MNISFTDKQEKYIKNLVKSGDYKNASEVVRAALRLHDEEYTKKLVWLRAEIQKGIDSPRSKRTINDIIEAKKAEHLENA